MPLRSNINQNLQNYPKIQIDRSSVIKPCVTNQVAADQFIEGPASSWKKILHDVWHEGIPFILRCASDLQVPTNSNKYYTYFIRVVKYLALLMLHIQRVYLYVYGYFYPYSLLTLDELCNEFSRCPNWTESIIRAFAWHPNHDRCAVAICNDYIYVYEGPNRIRVLRHNHQRKIVDLAWKPNDKEVLVVATQTHIILWRVSDSSSGSLGYKDGMRNPGYAHILPGMNLIMREKESQINGFSRLEVSDNNLDLTGPSQAAGKNLKLLTNVLPAPIVSIQFDLSGDKLYACSPNSSKIAILNIAALFSTTSTKDEQHVEYLQRYGQGVTKLLWSPDKARLVTATTSSFFRVFEPFQWTCNKWAIQGSVIQDMVWSKPMGRMLLIANKTESCLYALPFLDSSQPKDVGGNKSLMKALDLSATRSEFGDLVGSRVQSLAWDKSGKRLAISFKDNPESILLYRTVERPTVEFHQLGVIKSDNKSIPLLMDFHDKFKNGALLTICWSDGNCQHLPLSYTPIEQNRPGFSINNGFNNSMDQSINSSSEFNSSAKTPRSLTNFCHVSGNNSITSYPSSMMPMSRLQHQTTLFSLSEKSILSRDSTLNDSEP